MRKLHVSGTIIAGVVIALTVQEATAHGKGHDGVQWPALRELDELAERGEALIAQEDLAGLRSLAGRIKAASQKLVEAPLPKDVRSPLTVKLYLEDVASLAQLITDPATMAEADLKNTIAAFHPVVMAVMAEAGMPHVHDHSHGPHEGEVVESVDAKGHSSLTPHAEHEHDHEHHHDHAEDQH